MKEGPGEPLWKTILNAPARFLDSLDTPESMAEVDAWAKKNPGIQRKVKEWSDPKKWPPEM